MGSRPLIDFTRMYSVVVEQGPYLRLARYGHPADVEFWDRLWDKEIREKQATQSSSRPIVREIAKWMKGGYVLEAGCGDGIVVHQLNLMGIKCEGLDFAPKTVISLQQIFPRYTFHLADVQKLPLPANCYDGYVSLGVLEHFEDSTKMETSLLEARRILKPEGVLFLTVPYFNPWRRLRADMNLWHESPQDLDFFEYEYSLKEVVDMVNGVGFSIESVETSGSHLTVEQDMWLGRFFYAVYSLGLRGVLSRLTRLFPSGLFGHTLRVIGRCKS